MIAHLRILAPLVLCLAAIPVIATDEAEKTEAQGDQVDPVKALMESMKDDPAKKP